MTKNSVEEKFNFQEFMKAHQELGVELRWIILWLFNHLNLWPTSERYKKVLAFLKNGESDIKNLCLSLFHSNPQIVKLLDIESQGYITVAENWFSSAKVFIEYYVKNDTPIDRHIKKNYSDYVNYGEDKDIKEDIHTTITIVNEKEYLLRFYSPSHKGNLPAIAWKKIKE